MENRISNTYPDFWGRMKADSVHNTLIILLQWKNSDEIEKFMEQFQTWGLESFDCALIRNDQEEINCNAFSYIVDNPKNLGYAVAVNQGIELAILHQYDQVALLNVDIRLAPETLHGLSEAMRVDQLVHAVSPVIVSLDGVKHWGGIDPSIHLNTRTENPQTEIDYLPGTCLFVRTSIFKKIGMLDPAYFFSGEIADLGIRMKKENLSFYCVESLQVTHLSSDSHHLRDSLYVYYNFRNRFLMIDKFHRANQRELRQLWTKRITKQMLGALLRLQLKKYKALRHAKRDGLNRRFGKSLLY